MPARLLAFAFAAAAACTPALAADGPYAGAAASWTTFPTEAQQTIHLGPGLPPISTAATFEPHDFTATILLGYRMQIAPGLLAGVEVDGTFLSGDWLATARGVLGYQLSDDLTVLATAGAAWLDTSIEQGGVTGFDDTVPGWAIGAGAEHLIGRLGEYSVLLRGDYLYADFDGVSFETGIGGGAGVAVDLDIEMHRLHLGLVLRAD